MKDASPPGTGVAENERVIVDVGAVAAAERARRPSFLPPIAADVDTFAALRWLRLGLADLRRAWPSNAWFGLAFTSMGLLLALIFVQAPAYLMAAISGFLLIGPFVCTGCYELSRNLECGQHCSLWCAATAFRRSAKNITIFAVLLLILELLWGRASLVLFALFYEGGIPDSADVLASFLRLENTAFVIAYLVVGGIFASLVFITAVVAIPMLLDRPVDAITAGLTSFRVCLRHPLPLALWGGAITLLTLLAMAPAFLGLIVVGPWLGHATWHAYRELVPPIEHNEASLATA